jgi:hypothetical protein
MNIEYEDSRKLEIKKFGIVARIWSFIVTYQTKRKFGLEFYVSYW